jgi:hypothetical protein
MQANSTLLTEALCDNLHLGLVLDAAFWSKELLQGLMFIDSSQDWRAQMLRKQRIDPTRITQLSQEKFIAKLSDYMHDPTNHECTTRKHCVCSEWMVGDAVEQHGYTMPAYLRAGCHKHMKRALTRVRLSNAPIAVNTQSYAIPYSDRVCSRCNSMALDNEQHLLF